MRKARTAYQIVLMLLWVTAAASAELGKDWVEATPAAPWGPRYYGAAVAYKGKMWVIGGDVVRGLGPGYVWSSTDGTSWTASFVNPPWATAREQHAAVVFKDRIWIIGGITWAGYSDVWYTTDGVHATSVTLYAPWPARVGHTAVVFNNKMWVLGGCALGQVPYMNDVWYSSDGTSWTQATPHAQWGPRAYHTSVVHDGKIWVFGGEGPSTAYLDTWCSSNGTTWTAGGYAPRVGGWKVRAVAYNGKIWLMGGQNWPTGLHPSDVWSSADGMRWTQVTPAAPWPGREDFMVLVHNRKMWVLGGRTDTGWPRYREILLNDVWYSELPSAAGRWWRYP